jgi:phosphatidylinositol glycan class V
MLTLIRNVGFLRYWTVSNIPLFLLALPMIAILIQSSTWTLGLTATVTYSRKDAIKAAEVEVAVIGRTIRLLRNLAAPQFLLAAMALASYHVQIITRISSGYPVWYIWLASNILQLNSFQNNKADKKTKRPRHLKGLWQVTAPTIVKYMIVYGLVQAGLFSSFLPPA